MKLGFQKSLAAAGLILSVAVVAKAQEGDHAGDLPLPELEFELQEEAEEAKEYLVDKPVGYLRLPSWSQEDKMAIDLGRSTNLGGGLWPGQRLGAADSSTKPAQPDSMDNGFRTSKDSRISLPDVKRTSPKVIPKAYLPYYFGERPKGFLNDVQRLLTEAAWEDIDWYLSYHANESVYGTHVFLFSPDEEIPAHISGEALLNEWFAEENRVLVFYFYGRPERAQVFFPDALRDKFSSSDFQQNLIEVVESASRVEEPGKQLDQFCQKVGTWLIWWEKRLKGKRGIFTEPFDVAATDRPQRAESPLSRPESPESGFGSVFWAVVTSFGLLLLGLIAWAIKEMFGRKNRAVFLPQKYIDARLGAPHSGGGSAVLTFGSKS